MSGDKGALRQALAQFDRGSLAERIDTGEAKRAEALERFPLDSWPEMTLDRYALGTEHSQDSFCYWMEWGTRELGSIAGGSAKKHIIFLRNDGQWSFPANYSSAEEAWEAVRAAWVECFADVEAGRWSDADAIEALQLGKSLQLKAAHIYFKDDVLPVASAPHLLHFANLLEVAIPDRPRIQRLELNRDVLLALREIPEAHDWTTNELGHFLYQLFPPERAASLVKIAPGEQARIWDECLAGGYICVGWDEVRDLRSFGSKEEFEQRFTDTYLDEYSGNKSATTKKARELWTLMQLEPGDLVVANKGKSHILGVGTVVDPGYIWEPNRPEFKHTVKVEWDTSYAKDIPTQGRWGLVTVAPIRGKLRDLILGTVTPGPDLSADPVFKEIEAALEWKNQAILYGPPGTGKTYTAQRFALWWLLAEEDAAAVEEAFANPVALRNLQGKLSTKNLDQRVWWIVASPAEWAWSQLFTDGSVNFRFGRLRRNFPLVQVGDLVVGYESTPTKRIVALARVKQDFTGSTSNHDALVLEPVSPVANGPTYADLANDAVMAVSEPMRFKNQGTLFALTQNEVDRVLSWLVEADPSLDNVIGSDLGTDAVGQITNLTFHPSFSYEDFIEGFRPVRGSGQGLTVELTDGVLKRVCIEAQANPEKRFLLIIDEINRAHVAKVFGEIITLLEKDKRGMKVMLPQSKDPFTVPPNVYLLGTMNTADRSIKLLDAALRRRFAFVELMPDTSIAGPLYGESVGGTLRLDEFLDGLNAEIASREGREKQIGHSFFLSDGSAVTEPDAFARIFRQEVLPLLQEYCYEDYATLAGYLGDELVDGETKTLRSEILNDSEQLIDALTRQFSTTSE